MKRIVLAVFIIVVLQIVVVLVAFNGSAHDTSCAHPPIWITYCASGGLLLIATGLIALFRARKKSWPKSIIFGLLISFGLGVISIIAATLFTPGSIFHCYVF